MELYFLRHGIAVEPGDFSGKDADRPLTPEGVKRMTKAAQGMKALDLVFDAVLSSPYVRARHTAEIAAKGVGYKDHIHFTDALTPGAAFKDFLQALREHETSSTLLLAGHQPSISEFVEGLVAGKGGFSVDFKKGALCLVEYDPHTQRGHLKWFLTSSLLRTLAR